MIPGSCNRARKQESASGSRPRPDGTPLSARARLWLVTGVAPEQVDGYYRGDGVPGYRPGEEEEAYYERQHAWLGDKLRALRGGETAPSSGGDRVARGDELLRKVQMEGRDIERYGAGPTADHMAHQFTDAARRCGADAGFPDEPPPLGGIQIAPAARPRRLEAWLEPQAMAGRAS